MFGFDRYAVSSSFHPLSQLFSPWINVLFLSNALRNDDSEPGAMMASLAMELGGSCSIGVSEKIGLLRIGRASSCWNQLFEAGLPFFSFFWLWPGFFAFLVLSMCFMAHLQLLDVG